MTKIEREITQLERQLGIKGNLVGDWQTREKMVKLGMKLAEYSEEDWRHSVRVADQNVRVVGRVRIPGITQRMVYRESLSHDVGKTRIEKKILFKPGALTKEERSVINLHSLYGAEILEKEGLSGEIALHHHSYFGDGSTNPGGVYGENLPLAARLLTIIDWADALRNPRIYRDGTVPHYPLLRYLNQMSGEVFDPRLVNIVVHRLFAGVPDMVANDYLDTTQKGWEDSLILEPIPLTSESFRRKV